ncbi:uncharacterized protein LOC144441466 [Glandiceps talaboti]
MISTHLVTLATASTVGVSLVIFLYVRGKKRKIPLCQVAFGKEMREQEFMFYDDVTPCNHGSFGSVPRRIFDVRNRFLVEYENSPDIFENFKKSKYYEEAREAVSEFVGAKPDNLVFVVNATTGINAVMKSLSLDKDDTVLVGNLTYPAMVKTAQDVREIDDGDIKVVYMDIKFPIHSKDDIIQYYRETLSSDSSIKVAIIDHITSSTAMVLPVKELIQLCHQYGVQVIIDGAHAPGHVHLNLEELNADYYTGNFHKWVYTPRGCAFLWIHPKHHATIKPLLTSHNFKKSLHQQFYGQGTRDESTFLTTPAAIQFYNDIGGMERIQKYTRPLLEWGMAMLSEAWGTEILSIPADMRAPNMGLVALPLVHKKSDIISQWSPQLLREVYDKHHVNTAPVEVQGRMWCRISVNVYTTKDDLMKLRDAYLDIAGNN